jgi:hypothetical protein
MGIHEAIPNVQTVPSKWFGIDPQQDAIASFPWLKLLRTEDSNLLRWNVAFIRLDTNRIQGRVAIGTLAERV